MIPLTQKFKLYLSGDELDVWGEPKETIIADVMGNLRSEMGTTRDTNGDEKTYNYTILFEGFVNIRQGDRIEYTEPNGEIVSAEPIRIKFMRGLDGEVKFTKVVF